MKAKELYDFLAPMVLPCIERYQTDFTKHDKTFMDQDEAQYGAIDPFVLFAGNCGTYRMVFYSLEKFPKGKEKTILFFHPATKEEILATVGCELANIRKNPEIKKVFYYDGKKVSEVTFEEIDHLLKTYKNEITKGFENL